MANVARIRALEEDGVLFPIPVLSIEESAFYLSKCNELETAMGGKPDAIRLTQLHLAFPWAYQLATHSSVLDLAGELLGPNIAIWATSIFSKHANDERYVGWHQDGKYWGLDCEVVSVWIALTESTAENGCMRVVRGSHLSGLLPHREAVSNLNVLSRQQEIGVAFDRSRIVDVVLQPGEASIHHLRVIHGSPRNTSNKKRIGFVVRYVSPEALRAGAGTKLMLARGADSAFTGGILATPPEDDSLSPESLARFEAAAREFLSGVHRR